MEKGENKVLKTPLVKTPVLPSTGCDTEKHVLQFTLSGSLPSWLWERIKALNTSKRHLPYVSQEGSNSVSLIGVLRLNEKKLRTELNSCHVI